MLSRREAVLGGALTLLFTSDSNRACGANESAGCLISNAKFDRLAPGIADTRAFAIGNEPIIPKSSDANFDFALAQTLAKLARTLEVLPGFAYYDDLNSHNAYATSRSRLSRTDGTVLFGTGLLKNLQRDREHPEVSVAAICAHEFGHILQFKSGLIQKVNAGQPTVKRSELQADYFAGYFAGIRRLERPQFPSTVVITTLARFGDYDVDQQDHHGTARERGDAVQAGFKAAYTGRKNLSSAIEESTSYVMTL